MVCEEGWPRPRPGALSALNPKCLPPAAVVAAAVLFADRKSRGLAPYWPSALASLTGYSLSGTPELAAAVGGAQR